MGSSAQVMSEVSGAVPLWFLALAVLAVWYVVKRDSRK